MEHGLLLARPAHRVQFNPAQQAQVDRLLRNFIAQPYAPPSVKDSQAELGEELYAALLDQGELVQVSPEVVFRRVDYETWVAGVRRELEQAGSLTLAQFRDQFGTSRKYAQAFLEHLDATGLTQRDGDARKLRASR